MNDAPEMSPADEAAALWLFRHDVGLSAQDESEFAAWLTASDANVQAWERSSAAFASIGLDDDPFLQAMRTDALSARARPSLAKRLGLVAAYGAAALVVATVGVVGWQSIGPSSPNGTTTPAVASNDVPRYRTGDEPKTVTLPDGSEATLDRQTALALDFSDRRRDLRVLRGEALFDVRHDGRTFAVTGVDTTVTATGTRFAVQVLSGSVVATLERGAVTVTRAGDAKVVKLVPGQQALSTAGRPIQVAAVDPAEVLQWAVTYVTFNDTPLDQAVTQMAAHSTRPIRVVGSAARMKVTGRFRADDPRGFIMAVTQFLPVRERLAKDGAIELVACR